MEGIYEIDMIWCGSENWKRRLDIDVEVRFGVMGLELDLGAR